MCHPETHTLVIFLSVTFHVLANEACVTVISCQSCSFSCSRTAHLLRSPWGVKLNMWVRLRWEVCLPFCSTYFWRSFKTCRNHLMRNSLNAASFMYKKCNYSVYFFGVISDLNSIFRSVFMHKFLGPLYQKSGFFYLIYIFLETITTRWLFLHTFRPPYAACIHLLIWKETTWVLKRYIYYLMRFMFASIATPKQQ